MICDSTIYDSTVIYDSMILYDRYCIHDTVYKNVYVHSGQLYTSVSCIYAYISMQPADKPI